MIDVSLLSSSILYKIVSRELSYKKLHQVGSMNYDRWIRSKAMAAAFIYYLVHYNKSDDKLGKRIVTDDGIWTSQKASEVKSPKSML